MRILILNWKDPLRPDAGGAERYVQAIAEAWAAKGHTVAVVVPCVPHRPRREVIRGVAYIRMGSRLTLFTHARRYLRRSAAEWDVIVESVSTRPFFAHRVPGARATALYHQIADDVWHREFPATVAWLGRYLVEPAWLRRMRDARVVAVSPSTARDLERHRVPIVACAPPATDIPRRLRSATLSGDAPRFVFLGRLCHSKRPLDALAAFEAIRKVEPDATLDVLGDGYLAASLARRAAPGVTIHGHVDEATKIRVLDEAHAMLLPATREGFGIVAIEAAARGLPVVAYDVPGLRDAIVHGITGILVPPTADALAQASVELLRDPARWRRISQAAYRRSLELTWEVSAERLLAVAAPASGEVASSTPALVPAQPR